MAASIKTNNTILIVEENQRMAFLLDFLLSREGYQVVSMNPVQEHEAIADDIQPPKLIIMGSRISFANNNRLITRIRNQQRWKSVPIIILIETFIKEKMKNALDAGANDFLLQPFDSKELVAQITRHTVCVH
ncbi:MAG: response regulator [Gammaproteobacteria bacterium]|nr:response regulator [Gammaproteobacteria bacterium]MDH5651442.1 response regulator [Gammaproteobacteria bacterium]